MKDGFVVDDAFIYLLVSRIFGLPAKSDENDLSVFLMESMFRCPIITLLEYLTQRFFRFKVESSCCSHRLKANQIESSFSCRFFHIVKRNS